MDTDIIQESLLVVVNGFGYKVRHVAQLPSTMIETAYWPSRKYPFTAARRPVVALCGHEVRSVQPVVIVYSHHPGRPDPLPTCPLCAYIVADRELALTYPDRPEVPE